MLDKAPVLISTLLVLVVSTNTWTVHPLSLNAFMPQSQAQISYATIQAQTASEVSH